MMIEFIDYLVLFFGIFVLITSLLRGSYLISLLMLIIVILQRACFRLIARNREQQEQMKEVLTAAQDLAIHTNNILDGILKVTSKKPVKRSKKRVVHA